MNKEKIKNIVLKNLAPVIVFILVLFGIQRNTAEEFAPQIEQVLQDTVSEVETGTTAETYVVTKVYDGDTITLSNNERVRLIGIDAPEVGDPFATSSRDFLAGLTLGKEIRLEKDKSDTDKYGRLLRYVYVDDELVNLRMVEVGLAQSLYIKPDITKYQEFLEAEERAQQLGIGMWE